MTSIASVARRARLKLLPPVLRRMLGVRPDPGLVRLGSAYGGWIVPDALLDPGCVCYCAGLGEDGTFDIELSRRYGCEVHTLDPTPRACEYAAEHLAGVAGVHFHPVGLWSETRSVRFYVPRNPNHVSHSAVNLQKTNEWFDAPCSSVRDLMTDLGHDRVDVLKLDIEGAEFEVLGRLLCDGIRPGVICVEFDQPAPTLRVLRQVRELRRCHYRLVSVDLWNFTFVQDDSGER